MRKVKSRNRVRSILGSQKQSNERREHHNSCSTQWLTSNLTIPTATFNNHWLKSKDQNKDKSIEDPKIRVLQRCEKFQPITAVFINSINKRTSKSKTSNTKSGILSRQQRASIREKYFSYDGDPVVKSGQQSAIKLIKPTHIRSTSGLTFSLKHPELQSPKPSWTDQKYLAIKSFEVKPNFNSGKPSALSRPKTTKFMSSYNISNNFG